MGFYFWIAFIMKMLQDFGLSKIAFFFALLFSSTIAFAQKDDVDQHIPRPFISRVEFTLGTTMKLARGPDINDISVPSFGFGARIGVAHEFSKRFELLASVAYQPKGTKIKVFSLDYGYTPPAALKAINDNTLNYAEVSIVPRVSLGQFNIGLGPYVGYLINGRRKTELYRNGELIIKNGARQSSNPDFKDFDFGIAGTAGWNFLIKKKIDGIVEFWYCPGLIDINKPTIADVRNNIFSLQIGLSLQRK
jgi:hypothetical protein